MAIPPETGNGLITLYHFWSSPESQRVRLALGYKRIPFNDRPLAYGDDETFFALGLARQAPVLRLEDGRLWTDSTNILRRLDEVCPERPIFDGVLDEAAWRGLLAWRARAEPLLRRLYAPVLPAFADIRGDDNAVSACRRELEQRLGVGPEALSNDRYAAYAQLDKLADLKGLARRLAGESFYIGQPSAADMLLAADLFPLQLLDGVSLPIDLMYYIQRIEDICGKSLRDGLPAGA